MDDDTIGWAQAILEDEAYNKYALARKLEDAIEQRDQQTRARYVWMLRGEIGISDTRDPSAVELFMLIRATPEQRARAFLAAVQA